MATPKAIMLLAVTLLVMISFAELSEGSSIDCNGLCTSRCSKSWKPKMCMRACGTCCQRCNCVPPGPTASKEVCPCYANMRTHGGKYKCP